MKRGVLLLLVMVACAGCDRQRYPYETRYQEYAHASLELDGRRVLLTARAAFVDVDPGAATTRGSARDDREMTAEDRYRYAIAHPEIFGPIGSRAEYAAQFGEESLAETASRIEIVMSGDSGEAFVMTPRTAALSRGGVTWRALDADTARLAVGARDGGEDHCGGGMPVTLRFPALPAVAGAQERLTRWQINRRPPPARDPIELTVTLERPGGARPLSFRFDRVAEHPPFPPNPLYRLYAAH